jgi:hypothetical protein
VPGSIDNAGRLRTAGAPLHAITPSALPAVVERVVYQRGPGAGSGAFYTPTADDLAATGDMLRFEASGCPIGAAETVEIRYGSIGSFPTPLLTQAVADGTPWSVPGVVFTFSATLIVQGVGATLFRWPAMTGGTSLTGRSLGSSQFSIGYGTSNSVNRYFDYAVITKIGAP